MKNADKSGVTTVQKPCGLLYHVDRFITSAEYGTLGTVTMAVSAIGTIYLHLWSHLYDYFVANDPTGTKMVLFA